MNIKSYMKALGEQARVASRVLIKSTTREKNCALLAMADVLENTADFLKYENTKDLKKAKKRGFNPAMLERLAITDAGIAGMVEGLRQVANLQDPTGEITDMSYRPSGIQVGKMRVPLGVVGIIYESRPNVTIDAAALCLKSGNVAILRGGSEATFSNQALATCIKKGLTSANLPKTAVQIIKTTDRDAVAELITMPKFVDVIIPRGGKGLIEYVTEHTRIPVIKHLDGVCHVYIDDSADYDKAIRVAINSKTHRYGVCNAMETLLVAESQAQKVLPELAKQYKKKGVELRGCIKTRAIIKANIATDEDWATEYLAAILSIRIVKNVDMAIAHIAQYSSGHTESIITEDFSISRRFLVEVDSSSVMVNTSTRFADGFEYGLGSEIGISTDKFHARGPVGLEGLTSQKYIVFGDGHIRP